MNTRTRAYVALVAITVFFVCVFGYINFKKPPASVEPPLPNDSQAPLSTSSSAAQNSASQKETIDSFAAALCDKEKFPAQITKGSYLESDRSRNQFFVYCKIPQTVPIPSLYIIEQEAAEQGGFQVRWSKLLDNSSGLRSVETPEIIDVDNDGLSEIYWGGAAWGGTCAPHAQFGYLFSGKYSEEFSIARRYEFSADCTVSSILKETQLTPDPVSRNAPYAMPFYDYLKSKVPIER